MGGKENKSHFITQLYGSETFLQDNLSKDFYKKFNDLIAGKF
jgi:cytochrome b involved in lipid metabolism